MFGWKACGMAVRYKAGFALWREHWAAVLSMLLWGLERLFWGS